MKLKKKVRNVNKSKSLKKEQVGPPAKLKLFGQENQLPVSKPKDQANKLDFEKGRKKLYGLK